jgi:hypothetical protein
MFDCGSSQFLAIEEALNDSNRRIAMPTPAASQYEVEVLDGTLELFFAAEHIVNGLSDFLVRHAFLLKPPGSSIIDIVLNRWWWQVSGFIGQIE